MIFVFLFLLVAVFSFSADSRQQDMLAYRLRPYPRPPHFSPGHLRPANDVMCLGLRDWADISTNCNNDAVELLKLMTANKPNEKMVDHLIEGRSKNKNNGGKDTSPMMDRSFGFKFLGFNALANYLINSVSYTTTSTSYSTSYSTLTIGTVATCYTSTMFGDDTTACVKKKRELSSSSSSITIDNEFYVQEGINLINPSLVQGIEASFSDSVNIIVQREGKSFFDNIQRILASSMSDAALNNENGKEPMISPRKFGYAEEFLENLPVETLYVSASTITSFVLYTTTATKTVTNFAGNDELFCLPSCFTLC